MHHAYIVNIYRVHKDDEKNDVLLCFCDTWELPSMKKTKKKIFVFLVRNAQNRSQNDVLIVPL